MEPFKIPQVQEVRIIHPVITSREQTHGQPTIQTGPVNQLAIPAQPRIEVQLHVPARLKAIQNRTTRYLQQVQRVRVAVIVQIPVRRAVQHLQEAILQGVHRLREVLLQVVLHPREAVVQVVAAVTVIQEEAVQVEAAQVEAAQEEAEAVAEVHLQVAGGNYF
jgi:hypothetical protein